MAATRVLLLVGSPTSDEYRELSEVYARGCLQALDDDPARYAFVIALVTPDGMWRFPSSLDAAAVDAAPRVTADSALMHLSTLSIDIALPQMFCLAGMTDYRALLDVLKIPYLGNRPLQMAIAADKAKAKAIVAAAGVRTPASQLIQRGDVLCLPLPVVVKPNNADNSDGVALVRHSADYDAAIATALSFSPTALVEEYIVLGREVRCGVVVEGGVLRCLPLEEYFVDTEMRPVRRRIDKLKRNERDELTLAAKHASQSWIVPVDDPIVEAVWDAARRCHRAIGCEQYSLFDFRIDPEGQPWFLEAGLYCSFSPQSVVVNMMRAGGSTLRAFFADAIRQVLPETHPDRSRGASTALTRIDRLGGWTV